MCRGGLTRHADRLGPQLPGATAKVGDLVANPKLKRRACYTRAGTESMAPRQHARLEEMGLLRPAALGSGVLCLNEENI